MSWINLCSHRYALRKSLDENEFEEDEVCDDPRDAMPILLDCAIVGDLERLRRNADVAIKAYRRWESDLASGARTATSLNFLKEFWSLAVLLQLVGEESDGIAAWVRAFDYPKDDEAMALARLSGAAATSDLDAPDGHTEDSIEWPKVARQAPARSLLELTSCPTHIHWHNLKRMMAPAAAAYAAQADLPLSGCLRWGACQDAADRIVYERTDMTPDHGPHGFDAVIQSPDGLIGCYDLSMVQRYQSSSELAEILDGAAQDWVNTDLSGHDIRIYNNPWLDRVRADELAEAVAQTGISATLHSFLDAP